MPSKTFENQTEFIKIQHKETGEVITNVGTDYFSFDTDKFDIIAGGNACTLEQRNQIIFLMNAKRKHVSDLLDKYKRKNLKEFTYDESEGIIKFLESI